MLNAILTKIFGSKNEREIKKLKPIVEKINALEPEFEKKSKEDLRALTTKWKEEISKIEDDKEKFKYMDKILPEAFAAVREAAKRTLGMRHYDVQLIGGMVLHQGKIAEMRTGEGKTLVATLPVYLNALAGKGVHVVTVNDYLAKRDAEWMGPVYNYLGLSVGYLQNNMEKEQRKEMYSRDITYGTNSEFGFDYLRDNMAFSKDEKVQRELFFAIVDEADSILIDEARTPLIISGPSEENVDVYYIADAIVRQLKKDKHFEVDEKTKTAVLTDEGIREVEKIVSSMTGIKDFNLYDPKFSDLLHAIIQSLRAHHLFKKDVDYVVKDGKVVIVDEFTGRIMPGRRWSDGLHQAVEAKEGVKIEAENQTLATITLQNYFRLYKKLAGMTGTAETEAAELKEIYGLDVVVIPTNKPVIRKDHPDLIFKTMKAKYNAVVKEIEENYKKGRPVLVGTNSIEASEYLSRLLKKKGIPHQVLNAKHHEREAEIVAQAGRLGAVTIATNMAGRGTDILLGGNPEFLAKKELEKKGITPEKVGEEKYQEIYKETFERYKKITEEEKEKVKALGGLYIIGTERNESRRIDNQLRGRAGRQGDPGESRFFLSLEDNLLRLFGSDRIKKMMEMMNVPDDEPITHKMVSKALENAQRRVEQQNFQIRKRLLEYDEVYNVQRKVIYDQRNKVLEGEDFKEDILYFMEEVAKEMVENYAPVNVLPDEWDLSALKKALEARFGFEFNIPSTYDELMNLSIEDAHDDREKLVKLIYDRLVKEYEKMEKLVGEGQLREIERMIMLQTLDHYWRQHLLALDHIKESIGWRGYGQRDPIVEFKKEAFQLFEELISNIQNGTVDGLFNYYRYVQSQINES
ncbi:Protein translocase subunit secA [Desulfurobacterium thermolithotrophum DSM 11699]|uniref:Protein translocase subunit SecA n=1 Tax=Desulfurobacterium thermolithotrophum (strain DSM 11699 / BSA) TaxID=868864 RepID=F0S2X1_DESTD|nr:preprotein translocase subunit SecA [Desulfurobacterium thermolithotrophum]ADY73193.1 Protein translocase subunit secA [Desulfurobacterium thermolithotrophum DSM 11699]